MGRVIYVVLLLVAFGCGNNSKREFKTNKIDKPQEKVNNKLPLAASIGPWVKEGVECYGLVVFTVDQKSYSRAVAVRCRIVDVRSTKIQCRSLENIISTTKDICNHGIKTGETWWEKEPDLWQTKAEAEEFIKSDAFKSRYLKN